MTAVPFHSRAKSGFSSALGGCAILFGLPFAAAGLFCWGAALLFCLQMVRFQAWEQASARVVRVPESTDLTGLVYEYDWEGQTHFGNGKDGATRFFRASSADEQLLAEAREAAGNGQRLPIWINPRSPEQSYILPPQLSPGPLFLGIFVLSHGGAGFGIIGGTLASQQERRRRLRLQARYPDEPWKWRDDWLKGQSELGSSWWRWLVLGGTVAWGSIALPLAAIAFTTPEAGAGLRWGALGGAALTSLLGWWSWFAFRQDQLSRALVVSLPPGGLRAGARHVLELTDRQASPLRIEKAPHTWTLRCRERITTYSGGESSTRDVDRWQTGAEVASRDGSKTRLQFAIPARAPETSAWSSSESGVRWELRGRRPGEPEVGPYLLPVFGSTEEAGVEGFPHDDSPQPVASSDWEQALEQERVVVRGPGHFFFPPGRHSMASQTALILGAILTLFGLVPWLIPAAPWALRIALLLFFGLTGGLLLHASLRHQFGEQELEAGPDGLRLRKKLGSHQTALAWKAEEIKGFRVTVAVTYNEVPFYVIQVEPRRGSPQNVSPLFRHRPTAEAMRDRLAERIASP